MGLHGFPNWLTGCGGTCLGFGKACLQVDKLTQAGNSILFGHPHGYPPAIACRLPPMADCPAETNADCQGSTGATFECTCKKVAIKVTGKPLTQGICHCTECQAFMQADVFGFLVFLESQVSIERGDQQITHFSVRKPTLLRGFCRVRPSARSLQTVP